jgi:hypothetical protein
MKPVAVFLAVVCSLFAQSKPTALIPDMSRHHHSISTKSPEAQRFFDQGLTLVFAFNHEEAARSFRRAAELDPQSAMPYWGVALALGPCINLDVDPPHEKAAYEAVQKAISLSPRVTESERGYIQALANASAVGKIAVGPPVNGIVEIGGPEQFRLDDLVRQRLASVKDPREVVADPNARYSGAKISERTLVPGNNARLGETRFETWLTQLAAQIPSAHPQTTGVAVVTKEKESRKKAS